MASQLKIKRLAVLSWIGVLMVLMAAGYLYFWRFRPIGSGPAGPDVPAAAFTKVWSERPVLLVGLGDSVTAGFGARPGYSYIDRLVKNPADEFSGMQGRCLRAVLPNLQLTNLAMSGSTSGEHAEKQLPRLPEVNSNTIALVVLTTGGNDLIHNYGRVPPREEAMFGASWDQATPWITNFEQRLDNMIVQINRRFPGGCQIFLANIYDPTDGVGDIERAGLPAWKDGPKILTAYNDVIGQCAERFEFVHLVDLHSAFLGHGIHCTQFWSKHHHFGDPHYWYHTNLEDPNERGYDAIRRLFLLEILEISDQLR